MRRTSLILLLVSEVAAMSTWFATNASLAAIRAHVPLTAFHEALLTNSVQAGFVLGTLASALLTLPDRFDLRRLFSAGAAIAAVANLGILFCEPASPTVPLLRLVTGACMAAVYPVGMKLAATWAAGDLGLLIGLLVAALTLGSAFPHLIAVAATGLDWRWPVGVAASGAALAAILIRFARLGPNLPAPASLRLANASEAWRNRGVRLANLGYFGHMWELYAMWAWIGAFLAASLQARYADQPPIPAELAAFLVVGAGAIGALGGGWMADRFGRAIVTMVAMGVSGLCAASIGLLFGGPAWAVLMVSLVWGISVVADSAQFSAAVVGLSAPSLVGTMLTVQTCAGFLLTVVSIQLTPIVVGAVGWRYAFAFLAIGPILGIIAMDRLRRVTRRPGIVPATVQSPPR
ncbi:MFS transporter [Acidisphaera sp. L21]|uniref:MFS transporter n=1 Tax=Acidisphaera sp. L21 TaxID=1641851 RepID=UPI00131E3287|nr:MFS transporter [Acidisphaera sp. L21]